MSRCKSLLETGEFVRNKIMRGSGNSLDVSLYLLVSMIFLPHEPFFCNSTSSFCILETSSKSITLANGGGSGNLTWNELGASDV